MGNKYDEKYDIRLARYDEIDEIMSFIDTYWKKDHILARDRKFFEYEMVVDGQVNFIIAKDRNTNKIAGMHGFIMASKNIEKLDIWGSIWKVLPGSMGLLGVEIVRRAGELTGTRNFLSTGGNPDTTVPINRKVLKLHSIGKMQHFYCISEREEYRIAKINHYVAFKKNEEYKAHIKLLSDYGTVNDHFDFASNEDKTPYKDGWYIKHRYFEHPIYKYDVYGIKSDENSTIIDALIVCREQEYNGSKAYRIVDYVGKIELFSGLSSFLAEKLNDYEYIDLYCSGIDDRYIRQAGMTELTENDSNIIPNYFAPYVAENIDIWVGTPIGKSTFFKADGDQDRPV